MPFKMVNVGPFVAGARPRLAYSKAEVLEEAEPRRKEEQQLSFTKRA